ncbi:head-tail connector protein [Bacillus sp. FSL W7-1360]
MELEAIKNYLRIDHDEDDNHLLFLQEVAEHYVIDAVDRLLTRNQLEECKPFTLAVLLLISHWYKTRSATSEKPFHDIPHGVVPLVLKVRGWRDAHY